MRIQSKHHLIKFNGKSRICSMFGCSCCIRNMEGNITGKTVRRAWLGIIKFPKVEQTPYLFYKIINNLTPLYTKEPIPPLQQSNYSLRNRDVIGRIKARTEKFLSSFYPNCICEWNKLDPEIRLAPSVAVFKAKLLSKIRPPAKSIYCIHDPIGLGPDYMRRNIPSSRDGTFADILPLRSNPS